MWAIKYRPQTLDNIVGNKEAIKLFKSFLKRPPKAILISGESGCGKTTIAKAFANDLGAVLYEFNVANTRGIDTVRTIIDMCKYRELGNKKRVILFDEAHQLTVDAQNALLKEVENYDDNIFIFSTTEPDDLIETLRNRCFHIKVYKLSVSECDKLINSLEKNGFSVAVVGTKKEIEKYFSGGEKFFGELDIEDIVYLISKSHTVVSVDSGIAHIAYALKKQLIVIFTSTKPEMGFFTGDYGKFVEYGNLRCRPCSLIGKDHCPQKHHLCSLIPYQKVEREIKNA